MPHGHNNPPRPNSDAGARAPASPEGAPEPGEFPGGFGPPVSRRDALRLMGASAMLAGGAGTVGALGGCGGQAPEAIVPFNEPDRPELIPGKPVLYATTLTRAGCGLGVLAESRMGRPIKIEGNPEHPSSLGATDVWAQAAILDLYDPERLQAPKRDGVVTSWQALQQDLPAVRAQIGPDGAGLRILTGRITSPTLLAELARTLEQFPQARWHLHEPVSDESQRRGVRQVTGQDLTLSYRLDRARIIVSVNDDFLYQRPGAVRCARDFADGRRLRPGSADSPPRMNRLYVCEPSPSVTGSNADHRLPAAPSRLGAVLAEIARAVGVEPPPTVGAGGALSESEAAFVRAAAGDLRQAGPVGLLCVGHALAPELHALALAINDRLGALGQTVELLSAKDRPGAASGEVIEPGNLAELAAGMDAGEVRALLILGANPVYTAPADIDFARALEAVEHTLCLSLREDETALACRWRLPLSHELESWGDARCPLGIPSIQQPLIAPLHSSRSPLELLALLRGEVSPGGAAYDMVRAHWRQSAEGDFEQWWRQTLLRGFVEGAEPAPVDAQIVASASGSPAVESSALAAAPGAGAFELALRPDDRVLDGAFSANPWLQELPRPHSTLTWDNAALLAPADARDLGVADGDILELTLGDQRVEAPALKTPGQARGVVTLALGYGRRAGAGIAAGRGADAYQLQAPARMWHAAGLGVRATGRRHPLALTQKHHQPEGRGLLRSGTLAAFIEDPRSVAQSPAEAHEAGPPPSEKRVPLSLFEDRPMEGQQWGMSIDLTACIGCSACTIACQAENNIPAVGPEEVRRGRELHWIRVDRYHTGAEHDPQFQHQPVPCMHCERAPCEVVCPTAATQHSHDGLNDMIYNRCIGTRYCSNNCPYKVRRFNFLDYTKHLGPIRALGQNPDVTVRSRGVIEKCTYCVQRIRAAGIEARKDNRSIRDDELETACQAVCPTNAIVFGDVANPETEVSKLKALPHDYAMLEELNTRPRTTYLAQVRNPNPEFEREPGARSGAASRRPGGAGLNPAGGATPNRSNQEGA